jgi:uncharacterized membrane protein
MRLQLLNTWERLRASFWFVPTLMAFGATLLSFAMLALDTAVHDSTIPLASWAYVGSPEGARALLSTVAGSVITVAGVIFSITIAALTLASSQFGPRLLRNFLRDTGNQLVLGTFIATFLYCLLILRTIHGFNDDIFVPNLSVSVGVALSIASLGVLIYFIHHASTSIQVEHIIAAVGEDLDAAIDRLFPERIGHAIPSDPPEGRRRASLAEAGWREISARRHGYVQAIDADALMRIATEHGRVIQILHRPGQFVIGGVAVARAWADADTDEQLNDQIYQAFIIGSQRTVTQDLLFAVHQLVEIAVRALSPGINDPFTAIACIDQLGAGICRLAERAIPAADRYDKHGHLRVIAESVSFAQVVDVAFDQIRQYGRTSVAVTNHLLETIATIGGLSQADEQRAALLRQAEMIGRSQEGFPEALDRAEVRARYHAAVQTLIRVAGPPGRHSTPSANGREAVS